MGAAIATVTFIGFNIKDLPGSTFLFGIASTFIGTVFVSQLQEAIKSGKRILISILTTLEEKAIELKAKPISEDGNTEEKLYNLVKEIFIEAIKF